MVLGRGNLVHGDCGGGSFPEKFPSGSDGSAGSSDPPDILRPSFTARPSTPLSLSMQPTKQNVDSIGTSVD